MMLRSSRTISELYGEVKREGLEYHVPVGVECLSGAEDASHQRCLRGKEVAVADYHQTIAMFMERFKRALDNCPLVTKEFYNSFEYTRTGNDLSHSRTLGILVQTCYAMPGVVVVDVDVHLNEDGVKFQPDLVGRDKEGAPIIIVDFESPNSSDARVPQKDVEAYVAWTEAVHAATPYLIITSLPHIVDTPRPPSVGGTASRRRAKPKWDVRYTAPGYYNCEHKEFADLIRSNPFAYWYREYRGELKRLQARNPSLKDLPFCFANLDGLELELIDVWKS